jgi:DNA-binding GntR family transcriptional regulator
MTDVAFSRIEELIVTRQLPPGQMVSEAQLATDLAMGRTPVREALQRLRQLGFVEMRPRRGTSVCNVDVRQQLELLEVRRPLEELVIRCAAARASTTEREELVKLANRIKQAAKLRNVDEYFRANRAIHEAEVRAAHNGMLSHTMLAIHAQSRRFWYQMVEQADAFSDASRFHGAVLKSIAAADVEAGIAANTNLIALLDRLTRSALDSFNNQFHS